MAQQFNVSSSVRSTGTAIGSRSLYHSVNFHNDCDVSTHTTEQAGHEGVVFLLPLLPVTASLFTVPSRPVTLPMLVTEDFARHRLALRH